VRTLGSLPGSTQHDDLRLVGTCTADRLIGFAENGFVRTGQREIGLANRNAQYGHASQLLHDAVNGKFH